MAQLTLDDKREITHRLGYRLQAQARSERGVLLDPDGRHKGVFLPCKATDIWVWNEAVFRYRLHRGRGDGAVYRRMDTFNLDVPTGVFARVWPERGEPETLPRDTLEELGGADRGL